MSDMACRRRGLLIVALLMVCAQAQKRQGAQHVKASSLKMKAMEFEPLRWWCAAGKGNEAGALCKRLKFIEAIQQAPDVERRRPLVQQLRAKVEAGEVEGGTAANPLGSAERTRAMKGWCELNEGRPDDEKKVKQQLCGLYSARLQNVARRNTLVQFWCVDRKHAGSPKCAQLSFMRKLVGITSPQARAKAIEQFKTSRPEGAQAASTKEAAAMMTEVCASELAAQFATVCKKLQVGGDAGIAARRAGLDS